MPQRKPRMLARARFKPKEEQPAAIEPYVPPVKTIEDKLYDIIDRISSRGYRFTDGEYGFPWIRKEDIEHRFNGLFVIRFRCPVGFEKYGFPQVADEVQSEIGAKGEHVLAKRKEYGLPFIEGAWVLQASEESQFYVGKDGGEQYLETDRREDRSEETCTDDDDDGDMISTDDAEELMRFTDANFA